MPHAHAAAGAGFWPLTAMWFAMMSVMMAPTAWPWVRSFHRFDAANPSVAATARFGAGYLAAWLAYSLAAAFVQGALHRAGALDSSGGITAVAGALVFIVAGLYQFAPLKRACLAHCRSPFGYFLTAWRNGPAGAFRLGLGHGIYCVGCCWALMATALAVGVMNPWWMAALAALALVEQAAPHGDLLRRPLGAALIVAAVWRLAT